LSEGSRRATLERVRNKLGFNRILGVLDVSGGSLHKYLHGVRKISDSVAYRALQYLEEWEFDRVVEGSNRLRTAGIVRADGTVDYSLILQALGMSTLSKHYSGSQWRAFPR